MKDIWHSITKWADYNRFTLAGILLAVFASFAFLGCQPKTGSLLVPGVKVSAVELDQEVATINADLQVRSAQLQAANDELAAEATAFQAKVDAAGEDLKAQAELQATIVNGLGKLAIDATSGTLTPAAGIQGILSLILLGAAGGLIGDNIRKSRVISEQKQNAATVTKTAGE
jgi:hypothetical protein